MSKQTDKKAFAELQRVNEELSKSLEQCRFLLSECRSKLAANSNTSAPSSEGEESRLG